MAENYPTTKTPAKKPGSAGVLIVAVIMGLITVLLTQAYVYVIRKEVSGNPVKLYRLVKDVQPGHKFRRDRDAEEIQVPERFKETWPGILDQYVIGNYEGQLITRTAYVGDPITIELFQERGGALEHRIEPGKRGCPLPVNSRTAPGLLRPGMFIDIMATIIDENTKQARTLRVMEKVKVVAIGSNIDEASNSGTNFSAITVEVESTDADALLAVARYVGRDGFDILIRNPTDPARMVGVHPDVKKFLGLER